MSRGQRRSSSLRSLIALKFCYLPPNTANANAISECISGDRMQSEKWGGQRHINLPSWIGRSTISVQILLLRSREDKHNLVFNMYDTTNLETLYELADYTIYQRQSDLDFVSSPTFVYLESRKSNGRVRKQAQLVASIQDWSNSQDSTSSYGVRCLIEDIRAKGFSELQPACSGTTYRPHFITLSTLPSEEEVLVEIKFKKFEYRTLAHDTRKVFSMGIRYNVAYMDSVLQILKCRPFTWGENRRLGWGPAWAPREDRRL